MHKNLVTCNVMEKFINRINYYQKLFFSNSVIKFSRSKILANKINGIRCLSLFLAQDSSYGYQCIYEKEGCNVPDPPTGEEDATTELTIRATSPMNM